MTGWLAAVSTRLGRWASRLASPWWVVLLCGLFLVQAGYSAWIHSGTCDELGAHIPCGWLYWQSGVYSGGLQNFPLGQLLVTLPAKLIGLHYVLYTDTHLLAFRIMGVLLGLGLCLLVWRFTARMYGAAAGLVALGVCALDPNLLAHAPLATVDLPAAFFIFLTVFLLEGYLDDPRLPRAVLLSLALAAALLTKISAWLLLPYLLVVLGFSWRRLLGGDRGRRGRILAGWLCLPAVFLLLTWLVYRFPPGRGGQFLPPLLLQSLRELVSHSEGGHPSYFLGKYSRGGNWAYFPVTVLLKTPLPVLLLALAGLLRPSPPRRWLFLTLPVLAFLGLAMTSRINIGLRHVLMIYPFLAVAAGAGAARLWSSGRLRPLVPVLLIWLAVEAACIAPHHLSYFNELAGGPKNGHRALVDSNYDWGQNDRLLRRWIERTGFAGTIDPGAYRPVDGTVLVNANARYGVLRGGEEAYAWLRPYSPGGQIAYTWFIYQIPPGTFSAPPEDEEARQQVLAHLLRLREAAARVPHPGYRTVLARGFADLRDYDLAFEEVRAVLDQAPAYLPALALGGELMVRWKLGVLDFRGQEYLDGIHTRLPALEGDEDLERTIALAHRAGLDRALSRVEADLGSCISAVGNAPAAAACYALALRLDPANAAARERLQKAGGQLPSR